MAFDREKIRRRLTYLNDSTAGLRAVLSGSLKEYKSAKDETKRAVERYLQIISETQFDIVKIMYKGMGKRAVGDDSKLLDALVSTLGAKVINKVEERRDLRDELVHAYMDINDEKVFREAGSLKDVEEFKKAVEKALGSL